MKIHLPIFSECSVETDLWMQKKLDPLLFKIGCAQAAKNKWVEMVKKLVSRKVWTQSSLVSYIWNIAILSGAFWSCLIKSRTTYPI